MSIGRWLTATIGIGIFSSVWMERGRCVGIVPSSHYVLQVYCWIISITCILMRSKWWWEDVLGMIRAIACLWASAQTRRVVSASVDTSKVEGNSLAAILSIPTIHPIGEGPMYWLVVVSIQWQLVGMARRGWAYLT